MEAREGYPTMLAYADLLDTLAEHLPVENREVCHYQFSGVDFYWARIFAKLVCEDIAFDQTDQIPQMWWDAETYGTERRAEIINTLRTQAIIPSSSKLELLADNSEISKENNQFNNRQTTMLFKGGHDVLGSIEARFHGKSLEYGAIITVSSHNSLKDMEERFAKEGYHLQFSLKAGGFLAPYAMELKDIHVFLKG